MEYSRQNPAPGVQVAPMVMARVHISQSQAKAARTPMTHHNGELLGVFKPHMVGGAIGLGMMSTVKTLRSPVLATKGMGVRPGSRRRGHSRMGANTVFAYVIPKVREDRKAVITKRLKEFRGEHLKIMVGKFDTRTLQLRYESKREQFLAAYPEAAQELGRIESAHRKSLK